MSRFVLPLAFALALGGVAAVPAPRAVAQAPAARADDELVEKVRKAIDAGVRYLKKQQSPQGNWEGIVIGFLADMEGGSTALVTLALLEAGVPTNDAAVTKAVAHLVKLEPKKTYVVSLQTQVLARVDAVRYAKQIQTNADWLLKTAIRKTGKLEGWSYPQNQLADGSNTHFAVAGLHAAARAGAKVDEKVWKEIRDYYARTQREDGGWSYYNDQNERFSVSMTGAALFGLRVAWGYDKEAKRADRAFETGMAAFVPLSFESPKSTFYNMMVTAALGRALGGTEFKSGVETRAWYRVGVEKLLKEQKEDGSWASGRQVDGTPHLATAFALYFLGPAKKS